MAYYSDLTLNLKPHPMTGDITFLTDAAAVKRALLHIAQMRPYDIPFEPDLHGHIQALLFESPSPAVAAALESRIKWAFNKLEPRADIKKVDAHISDDETGYRIQITFSVLSLLNEQTIEFFVERIR